MGWTTNTRLPEGEGIFLFVTASRWTLGPTQASIQWVLGALSPEVKRPGHESDHNVVLGLRMHGAIPPTSHGLSWRGA